ncbi:MAG: helix-turn-helix transcriptional regulator [Sediminibacterium sp.]|nr:helix-turn-helix transcriptional regulator [Sediminibacterium sp.]
MSIALNKKLKLLVNGPQKKQDQLDVERDLLSARFLSEIQRHLETNGLTRKELAKRTGVSASFISQLFTAEKTLSLEFIAKVQRALGIEFQISAITKATKYVPGSQHLHKFKTEASEDTEEHFKMAAEPETIYKTITKTKKKGSNGKRSR